MNDFNINTDAYANGNKLNIAIDFDDTYTLNPELWNDLIEVFRASNFHVYCVTARPEEHMQPVYDTIGNVIGQQNCIGTGLRAKREYMRKHHNIHIHIWIDDTPEAIVIPNYYDSINEV
jgi:hypothetical protein